MQPGLGDAPFPFDCSRRASQNFGDLFYGQTGEILQLDDAGLLGVELRETVQGIVQQEQIDVLLWRDGDVDQGRWLGWPPALCGVLSAGAVNQDPAHEFGGDRKEVCTILPANLALTYQSEVGFINQSGGLKRVFRSLVPHVSASDAAQLVVYERHQLIERSLIPPAPGIKQTGDFFR